MYLIICNRILVSAIKVKFPLFCDYVSGEADSKCILFGRGFMATSYYISFWPKLCICLSLI